MADTPQVTTTNASGAGPGPSQHDLPEGGADAREDHGGTARSELARRLGAALGLEVLQELGRGARTVVYRVRRDGRPYALKVAASPVPEDDPTQALFRREAVLLAGVDHPDVTRVREVGRAVDRPYMIMDLVRGRTLRSVLSTGPLHPEQVTRLCEEIALMLAAAHRRNLVHHDVKPHNIMILPDGRAVLIDFGLLTHAQRTQGDEDRTIAGTFTYCAPEQSGMLHRPVDARSDLYSLGVVLFECLTGDPPFMTEDIGELLRLHAVAPPPSLLDLCPAAPPTLVEVVERLLAKDPDDRYPDADALLTAVRAFHPREQDTSGEPGAASGAPGGPARPDPAEVSSRERALVGRDQELQLLARCWEQARGGQGSAVLVHGVRGIGRSRLLAETAHHIRRCGGVVLEAACAPDDSVPLATLRAAIEQHLARVEATDTAGRDTALERLRSAAGPGAALLGTLSPRLATLLDLPPQSEEDLQEQFVVTVAGFLAHLARAEGGLALCLDDAQWLDDVTRRVLHQLRDDLDGTPLLLVATTLDGSTGDPATGDPGTGDPGTGDPGTDPTRSPEGTPGDRAPTVAPQTAALGIDVDVDLPLGTLDDQAAAQVLRGLLPGVAVPQSLVEHLTVPCAGNPFALDQYVQVVVDAGLLSPRWDTWTFDTEAFDHLDLPRDALHLALARWKELDDLGRRVLVVAATAGARFDADLVTAVGDTEEQATLDRLRNAVELRLLQDHGAGRYSFVHEHLRESLRTQLPDRDRQALHHAVAVHLAAAPPADDPQERKARLYAVARHFLHGDPDRDRRQAFEACHAAGVAALGDHAPAQALVSLEHAATFTEHADDPVFLRTLGIALQRDGRFTASMERFEQALDLERDPVRRARLYSLLAQVHRSLWATSASMDAVRAGLAELGTPVPGAVRLVLRTVVMLLAAGFVELTGWGRGNLTGERRERFLLRANLHETGGYAAALNLRPDTMFALDMSSLYLVARVGPSPEYARSYGGVGFLLRMSFLDRLAAAAFRRATRVARAVGDPRLEAQVAWHDAIARFLRGADDGQSLSQVTAEQGRWLDVGSFCDGIGCVATEALLRGDTALAAQWLERGHHRVGSGELAQRTALAQLELAVPAEQGLTVEAGQRYGEAETLLADPATDVPLRLTMLVSSLTALANQDDTGSRFASVTTRFTSLGIIPLLLMRFHLPFYVHHALGRLTRCRAAPPERRAGDLRAARRTVRALGRAARTDLLRAFHRVCRAELRRLDGRPRAALSLVNDVTPLLPDAPGLAFEVARVRARAWADLGHEAESRRQAGLAAGVARDQGWGHRLRWLEAEFSLDVGSRTHASRRVSRTSTLHGVLGADSERLAALEQVSIAASRVVDPVALARIALDETIRILGADRAFLFLTEEQGTGLLPCLGRDSTGTDLAEITAYSASLVERVRDTGEALVVTGTDEGEALGSQSVVAHGLRSILIAPVRLDERLLGVIYLDSRIAKGVFDQDDIGTLTAVSTHIAASLETARAAQLDAAVQVAHRERDLAESLRTTMAELSGTLDPDEVLRRLMRALGHLVPGDRSSVMRTERPRAEDAPAGDEAPGTASDLAGTASDLTALLLDRAPVPSIWDASTAPAQLQEQLGRAGSWLVLPLAAQGEPIGVVVRGTSEKDAYGDTELELATTLAAQALVAYEKAQLFTRIERMATVDELTGVPNRRAFFDRATELVARAASGGTPCMAVMVDIDFFKKVNDRYGHQTGDDVLRAVARRIAGALGESDVFGRYGGEEFAVVLPAPAGIDPEQVDRVRANVGAAPIETEHSGPVHVTLSAGMALMHPGDSLDQLLARADAALYRAKEEGRDRLVVA